MSIEFQFKPIVQWPRAFTQVRKYEPFQATYSDTLTKLKYELGKLNAENVVIQIALAERDIRKDGLPRSDTRKPDHPGVIVSFDSRKTGPVSFPCDDCRLWQHNIRAIALTLERLRLADLYGVTKHGEQYRGWTALPAPKAEDDLSTPEGAARFIFKAMSGGGDPDYDSNPNVVQRLIRNTGDFSQAYRKAALFLHPDNGGNHDDFVKLQAAAETLRKHHGLKP